MRQVRLTDVRAADTLNAMWTLASQAILPTLGDPAMTWIVAGLVLLMLEILLPGFVVGSFGAAALLTAIPAALGADIPWQVILFGVLGLALIIPARRMFLRSTPVLPSGVDRMVGRQVRCVEGIEGDLTAGVVVVDGARWTATAPPGVEIAAGRQVIITAVEGARLRVSPVDAEGKAGVGAGPEMGGS